MSLRSLSPVRHPAFVPRPPRAKAVREALALLLHGAATALARAARALLHRRAPVAGDPVLEFYAQAGAPEGALYVDGQLVGTLPGVRRL